MWGHHLNQRLSVYFAGPFFFGATRGKHFAANFVINGVGVKTVTALVGTLKAILCSLHNNANRHALPLRREVSYFLTK